MPRPASPEAVLVARRRFFAGSAVPEDTVAAPILRSWTRCAQLGLPFGRPPKVEPLTASELRAHCESHEALRRRSRPEIEALHADAKMTDSIVILTDPTGLVLDTVGSTDFADRAASVALRPGVAWSETVIGTNAIGTALVERRAIEVRGAEHYAEPHGFLSCSAAPILDPRGELLGVLDLSGPASVSHLHALGLVQLAVDHIEHRLFDGAFPGREVVRFHSDQGFLGTAREGVLVFEDYRLVAANRHGLRLLGLDWDDLLSHRFADLFAGSLGRGGEDRHLRSNRGGAFFVRVQRTETARTTPPPPASVAVSPDMPRPRFDASTAESLGRAVRLIDAKVPVLIHGETGTGKEVFARQMHLRCARAHRPFAAINCAALPEGLIESELFGYEEGAFTGARKAGFKGLLREADGGVLFLDEIGDMPLSLQTRLLRVLQEREVMPLGGGRAVPLDFALICASHRDLHRLVDSGAFRADLYFRIAQYTVELPPLRALPHREELVRSLWEELAGLNEAPTLAPDSIDLLASYDWPGNFRQFVGTLRVLLALAEPGRSLSADALPADIRSRFQAPRRLESGFSAARPAEVAMPSDLETVTRAAMRSALEASNGNISQAARRLGVHRSTLYRHLLGEGKGDKSA